MGNLVVTFLWDPIPSQDQKIIEELKLLTKAYSLSECWDTPPDYEEGKTNFGVENAGLWRLIINDSQVDEFSKAATKVMEKYKVINWRCSKTNLPI